MTGRSGGQWRHRLSGAAGRIGATAVGAAGFGVAGAAGGLLLGTVGDVAVRRWRVSGHRLRRQIPDPVHRQYLTAACAVMGYVAKADGRVSEAEIALASRVFDVLEMSGDLRVEAITLFSRGKRPDFPLAWVVRRFRRACGDEDELLQVFLEYQVAIAHADGRPEDEQRRVLQRIARRLGFTDGEFPRLLRGQRHGGEVRAMPQSPFRVLGVAESATPEQVRLAYRKLVSRHHPDRLQARGCSHEEIRAGASRTHAARRAYDQIRRQKGF